MPAMATNYPGGLDDFPNPSPGTARNDPTLNLSGRVTDLNDALEAVQTTLGVNPHHSADGATQQTDVAARLRGLDSMVWQWGETAGNPYVDTPIGTFVTSEYYGVYGDGSDETAEVQIAVDEATKHGAILVWPGINYTTGSTRVVKISDTINVPNKCRMLSGNFRPVGDGDFLDDGTGRPKVMFKWPSPGLNTGWWQRGTIFGRTGLAAGSKEGIGISFAWQQPSAFRDMAIGHFKVGMHVNGQVGRLDSFQFTDNDIGLLMTGQCLSMNCTSLAFVGHQEACVMYDMDGTYWNETGIDTGAATVSFRGTHIERSGNIPGFTAFDLDSAQMVSITNTWMSSLSSPLHTFLRMRDRSIESKFRANYSINDLFIYGADPTMTFVQDDYRSETTLVSGMSGNPLMTPYVRSGT